MARKPRVHYPGALYHAILRGNSGQTIFFDDNDRTRFYLLIQEGWTQEQFARNLGVTLNTVQRWETGKNRPSPLAIEKLKNAFQDSFSEDQIKSS